MNIASVNYEKQYKRDNLLVEIAKLSPCIIGMKPALGRTTGQESLPSSFMMFVSWHANLLFPIDKMKRMMPTTQELFVKPSSDQKSRFVSSKSEEQQALLCLHRICQGAIKNRTARINRLRGLLAEFGIIMPKGRYPSQKAIAGI